MLVGEGDDDVGGGGVDCDGDRDDNGFEGCGGTGLLMRAVLVVEDCESKCDVNT